MHVIKINKQSFTGPANWEELTCEGLLLYAQVLQCKTLSEKQAKHQMVMRLFQIPYKLYKLLPESRKILLHTCIDWVYEQNTLSNWLIRVVLRENLRLYGPQNKLADITGEEFMYCEAAYEKWLHSDDPALMDTLFAVLYRKKGFFNSKRLEFNPDKLQSTEKRAKKIQAHVKHAVMINYAGCRNLMIQLHPHIWKKAYSTTEGAEMKLTGWGGIFLELAGDKFGTYPQTIKTNIWLLLADLDKKAKNAEEMEASNR